ncbi:MAG: aminodeoxychorismate/anthranilate synthase component II [Bacteroidota bacterium]
MILVIDNYDSFTWNLVDILRRGEREVRVLRNDEGTVADALAVNPVGVLISPGPGRPADSGMSEALVQACRGRIPVLGICLGHQLLGEMFGARLVHAPAPIHGKTSRVEHDGRGLFRKIPNPMRVMRYHSLLLAPESIPPEMEVSAVTTEGAVMGIRHNFLNFAGVQFHPESVLTEQGDRLVYNWMAMLDETVQHGE